MKIKDITISIFAIIGLLAIITGFNNQPQIQETHSTVPESHVWEFIVGNQENDYFILNSKTGELRKVNGYDFVEKSDRFNYKTMKELN